jgi:hypothetical protein
MNINAMTNMIEGECDEIKAMLLAKNKAYGNSALAPVRIFSRADSTEQIRVRIDDKISRIMTADPEDHEDVYMDLIGYLILLRVSERLKEVG